MQWIVYRSLDGGDTVHSAYPVEAKNEKEAIKAAAGGDQTDSVWAAEKLGKGLTWRQTKHSVTVS